MALRFFADHCVSNQIIAALQEAGHEVIRLKDALPTESADGLVAAKAQQLDAILLSLNGDFADIVTYPPALPLRRGDEVPGFCFGVVRANMDFDSAAKRRKPGGEPINGHAFHAATKDFGKRRLVGAATLGGLLLGEFALLDRLCNCGDEHALGSQFRCLGGRKADIFKHVPAALVECLDHFSVLPVQCACRLQSHLDQFRIGFGKPDSRFRFFHEGMKNIKGLPEAHHIH
jgi:hypothetical protein